MRTQPKKSQDQEISNGNVIKDIKESKETKT